MSKEYEVTYTLDLSELGRIIGAGVMELVGLISPAAKEDTYVPNWNPVTTVSVTAGDEWRRKIEAALPAAIEQGKKNVAAYFASERAKEVEDILRGKTHDQLIAEELWDRVRTNRY